ncbi:MAG: VanZ family protein [Planctomycetes bacterium]|nr:VanZ family protein [Planctomycetota bacterium]
MRPGEGGGGGEVSKDSGKRWIAAWLPLLLYSGLIFYLSSQSKLLIPIGSIPESDKILHFGAYTLWGLLCAWGLARHWPALSLAGWVSIITLAGTLYGAADELHQHFVPGREASLWDLLADGLGGLAGAVISAWLRRKKSGEYPGSRAVKKGDEKF